MRVLTSALATGWYWFCLIESCIDALKFVDVRTFCSHISRILAWYDNGVLASDYILKRASFDNLDPKSIKLWNDLDAYVQYATTLGVEPFLKLMIERSYLCFNKHAKGERIFVPDLTTLEDKVLHRRVLAGKVKLPAIYGVIEHGLLRLVTGLPAQDIFVKCCNPGGGGGAGHHFLKYQGEGVWSGGAECRTYRRIVDFVHELNNSTAEPLFPVYQLQECVVNHPAIAAMIAPATALCTLRLTTLRTTKGRCVCTAGLIRIARKAGAFVDNWHAGGLVVGVDFASGCLHDIGFGSGAEAGTRVLGDTGNGFGGFVIPFWDEAKKCAEEAHEAFIDATGIKLHRFGSDVGITPDGPVFIEFNGMADARGQAIYGYEKPDGFAFENNAIIDQMEDLLYAQEWREGLQRLKALPKF